VTPTHVEVHWHDGHEAHQHQIEYRWYAPARARVGAAPWVLLHEGLGSVALWRDFPQQVADATGAATLAFSRWGYGQSSPRRADQVWRSDYMHHQAWAFLPAFFQALGLAGPVHMYGHSDGGSIALLAAARPSLYAPVSLASIVVAAPHILVEDLSVKSISQARDAYTQGGLRERLARYHADIDSAFWGWNRAWLAPEFRHWQLDEHLGAITCPVLALQGEDDEYGSMAQIDGIAARVPHTRLLKLPACGHSPHKDQTAAVLAALAHEALSAT